MGGEAQQPSTEGIHQETDLHPGGTPPPKWTALHSSPNPWQPGTYATCHDTSVPVKCGH